MNDVRKYTSVLKVFLATSLVSVTIFSCAAVAETSYTAEQLRCVDQARTREESRACRARVDERWNIDGGAR